MAKFLGWALFWGAIILLILYLWGTMKVGNPPPLPTPSTHPRPEPTIPPPTPVPGWTPRPSANARPGAPAAPGIHVPSRAHLALQSQGMDWQGMARDAGCELIGFSREGNTQVITLEAPAHSNFGRFLDAVMRTGRLRDPGPANMQQINKNGRVAYRTTYRLQMN